MRNSDTLSFNAFCSGVTICDSTYFCNSLVSEMAAAVAGAKYSIRLGSLLLAMAAARCTPAVVLRSQSAAARSVFRFTASMASVTSPICRSLNTANRLVSSDRERMRPSTQARRLAMDS